MLRNLYEISTSGDLGVMLFTTTNSSFEVFLIFFNSLCSLFPEEIYFDGTKHRTPRTNSIAHVIWLINSELRESKTDTALDFQALYRKVVSTGIEPISKV